MVILKNIPAAQKIIASLMPLEPIKRRIEQAHARGDLEAEKAAILDASYTWGTYLVNAFRGNITVYGRENLPQKGEGPVVFMCNHQGYADIPALCNTLNTAQFGFMVKDSLKQLPVYGRWMRRVRSVMIKREDPRASLKAIAQAVGYIEEGSCMLVFPEGTRSWGGPMNEFKAGAFKLATKPRVPIVPISINGTYKVFEEPGYFKNDQDIRLIIHPPIPTAGLDRKQEKALCSQVQEIVAQGVDYLRAEMNMPEHTAEEVELMKKRVNLDKMEQRAIKQLEKEESRKEKQQVKEELKAAREQLKVQTKTVKAETDAIVKEAKEKEKQKIKKAKEQIKAQTKEAKEQSDIRISAAILDAEYGDYGYLERSGEPDPEDTEE